jgi:3-oxoacyl-[acyl-carrier protein] reductase
MDENYRGIFDLAGRLSIVTGGGGGMGREIAIALASFGSDVLVVDVNEEAAEETIALLRKQGASAESIRVDLTDEVAPEQVADAAASLADHVDVLVNNAGILAIADFVDMTDDSWNRVLSVNLTAPMRLTRRLLPAMLEARNGGSIINIGSSLSSRGSTLNQSAGGTDYVVSKAGLQALTRRVAHDAAPFGVRANAIAPGVVDTPLHAARRAELAGLEKNVPLGRLQVASDVAGTAVFLASAASSYITGQTIHVNGGSLMVD